MRALNGFAVAVWLLSDLGHVNSFENGLNAPFEMADIKRDAEGFGSEVLALDQQLAALAPAAERHEKNITMSSLQDRSLSLMQRQSCNDGYWYCSSFGRCCPRSSLCCSYGYCLDSDKTCCPSGPCDPGYKCCSSSTCSPPGAECCSDGNYCSAGNVCVKLFDTGKIVCCTDLKCTAAVISGTTTMLSTTRPTSVAPVITQPPATTRVVVNSYDTWYWTVTWWYYSFYYTTIRAATTVTYTTIYSTTTYTTTATNAADASSRFSVLSQKLTFTPPASATSLASLVDAMPTGVSSIQAMLGTTRGLVQNIPTSSSTSSSSLQTSSLSSAGAAANGPGSASSAGIAVVGWILFGSATISGLLMIWL